MLLNLNSKHATYFLHFFFFFPSFFFWFYFIFKLYRIVLVTFLNGPNSVYSYYVNICLVKRSLWIVEVTWMENVIKGLINFYYFKYLIFIWLHWDLVAKLGIFFLGRTDSLFVAGRLSCFRACGNLSLWPRIWLNLSITRRILNHWTSREVLKV